MVLLAVSVVSDVVGKTMRKYDYSFLHPFSDKIMVLTLLFVFMLQGLFSAVILGIFVFRDLVISSIRMLAARDDVVIRGELYGKMITILQFILVFLALGEEGFPPLARPSHLVLQLFTLAAVMLGIISIIHYSYVYAKRLRARRQLGRVVEQEKIVILANKKSGGYQDKYRRYLLDIFAKRRNAAVHFLSDENMFKGVEKKIGAVNNIIIAGGDGTFEAALNYQPFHDKSLGFFPLGAGNSLYSYFYKGKRFEYLRSRFRFREVLLDVLELKWDKGKQETLFLSAGVDAEVVKLIKNKKRHSFPEYFMAGAKAAFGPRLQYNLECSVDGKKHHWNNGINIIIGKVPYIGFGIRSLLGKSGEDDSYIDGMVCANTHSPVFNKALRLWGMFLTQMGLVKAPLIALQGKVFVIKSKKEFPLQAGGDFVGYTKHIQVKVKRKQKVLMI